MVLRCVVSPYAKVTVIYRNHSLPLRDVHSAVHHLRIDVKVPT